MVRSAASKRSRVARSSEPLGRTRESKKSASHAPSGAAPRSERSTSAVSRAATTASQPLSSWLPSSPHRSRACSRVSQVSTPLPTGVLASRATLVSPAVTASQTYSKCGVPPRITAPRQATASCAAASSAATTGSSTAPATRTTSGSAIPQAWAAALARRARLSVISACQRVATMARLSPAASTVAPAGRPSPLISLPPSRALRWLREACPRRRDTAPAPAAWRDPRSVAAGLSSGLREPGAAAGVAVAVRGRQPVDPVTEAVPLGGEVAQVLLRRLDREGDHAGYLDPAGGQPRYLRRVVGEQPHRAHAEVGEYLCADGVVP